MFYKQLSNSYGPISPEKTWLKCSRFDEKPAEITNSCEVPGYPAVKLSSASFRQIFPAVLPGKGHSGLVTLLKVVMCRENDPFSQTRDWIEVLKCWTLTFWHFRNNGEKIIQQTLPSLRSHIMNAHGFSVTCNVTLKCYVTAETSPGNYARCTECGLLCNEKCSKPTLSLCHCFSWKKSPQFGNKMLYFSLSIKDMNLLVRLVWYLNFQCHFVSKVAGNFRQSSRR